MIHITSEQRRLSVATQVLAVSTLACLAFSWRLWTSTRLYPLVPFADLVPSFPPPLDAFVLAALAGLLVLIAARPLWRWPVAGVVVVFMILFLQDQSRLWPSFYEFFLLFLILLAHRPAAGEQDTHRILAGMQFVIAAVYFWGGFHKLTVHFLREQFPWFVQPLVDFMPFPIPGVAIVAAVVPVFEMAIGVGLLTRRFRGVALSAALAMHAVILVGIGPLRDNWNNSAWSWSLATAVLAWVLFANAPPFRVPAMLAPRPSRCLPQALLQAFLVVVLGFLPALNVVNCWDSALSFNVYTGNTSEAYVVMKPSVGDRLPAAIIPHVSRHSEWAVLDLNAWSRQEFSAGCYPERRVFHRIFASLCEQLADPSARLVIIEKAGWFFSKSQHELRCDQR